MATATFKLFGLPIPAVIEKVRDVIAKLIANAITYATPNPSPIALKAQTDALELSYQKALNGGKDKKAQMRLDRKALLQSMSILQAYIQTTSGGDAAKILLVADLKSPRSPVGILPPPGNVRSTAGALEGSITVRWDGVPGRAIYKLQRNDTPNDDAQWKDLANGLTGKTTFTTNSMESGRMYGFRVATVSSEGIGGWSDASYHRAK